jgi:hypothetical protein
VSDRDTIHRILREWHDTSFRLESLAHYSVDAEREEFDAFLRGDPLPPPNPPDFEEWFDRLRQERAEGRRRSRVHAIAGTLTPYLRYEIEWGYSGNAVAGEDIRILHAASWQTSPFGSHPPDFYLLDDERVVLMAYDDGGHWLGGELVTDAAEVDRYRRLRDAAIQASCSLAEYLAALRRLPVPPLAITPRVEAIPS